MSAAGELASVYRDAMLRGAVGAGSREAIHPVELLALSNANGSGPVGEFVGLPISFDLTSGAFVLVTTA